MALPAGVKRHIDNRAARRHVDRLTPQGAAARLHHQIAFARRWRLHLNMGGLAGPQHGFIQFELHLIGPQRAGAVGVVLPPVARAELHAGDNLLAGLHFETIGAPLYRETHLSAAAGGQRNTLRVLLQILLVVAHLPALAVGEAPVVVAPLVDQAHLEILRRQLFAFAVGIDDIEVGDAVLRHRRLLGVTIVAVVIDRFAVEQRPDAGQRGRRPDRLRDAARDRPAARLQQARLQDKVKRRVDLRPFALYRQLQFAFFVQRVVDIVQVAFALLLHHVAELIARQRGDRFARRPQHQLRLQFVARRRRAVEVAALDIENDVVVRRQRAVAVLQRQRHALRQEILYVKGPAARLAVAAVQAQRPVAGHR